MVFAVAVLLVVGAIVFTLFVRSQDLPEAPPVSPTAHLEQRKAQIYENLRDLNFEFRVGKLSDADYQKTKLDLQRELAKVLSEIDAIQLAQPKPVQPKPAPSPAKAAAATAEAKAGSNGNLCKHCGARFPQPMKFCGECGKAMAS
jgi:hypothetical protein